MAFAYVVRCSFLLEEKRLGFLEWLRSSHVAEVCAVGDVTAAEIVVLDGDDIALEIRYRFASRQAFEDYERLHAPRLRAEGIAAAARLDLSPSNGISFQRWTGAAIVVRAD